VFTYSIKVVAMKADVLRQMAEIHKALSTPVRLALMQILSEKDRTVNLIIGILRKEYGTVKMDRTNISKHLGILKNLGIISCVSQGQKRLYHLEAKCLINAMSCTLEVVKK
jgi:DNA-binding transcriptional ArsR family regulator